MIGRIRPLGLAALSALAVLRALPAAPPLTLEAVVHLALDHHERAAIAALETRAAEARVGQAWSVLLPGIKADLVRSEYASDGGASGTSSYEGWEANWSASQLVFDAQALPLVAQARAGARAARQDERLERQALSYEATGAFLDAYAARQVARAAQERLSLARRSRGEIEVRAAQGLVGSNDLTRAELELASAEREWVKARGQSRSSWQRLAALTGPLGTDSLSAPDELLDRSGRQPDLPTLDAALRLRPDIEAARERERAAAWAAREPFARWVPDVSVGAGGWTDEEEGFRQWDEHWNWSVGLAWSVFDGGLRLSQAAERRAGQRAARLRARWLERQAAVDLQLAGTQLEDAQAGLVRAEVALQAARRNAEESQELYRQGLVRALEANDAAVQRFEAEVERTRAQVAQAQAWLQLRRVSGLDPLDADTGKE